MMPSTGSELGVSTPSHKEKFQASTVPTFRAPLFLPKVMTKSDKGGTSGFLQIQYESTTSCLLTAIGLIRYPISRQLKWGSSN